MPIQLTFIGETRVEVENAMLSFLYGEVPSETEGDAPAAPAEAPKARRGRKPKAETTAPVAAESPYEEVPEPQPGLKEQDALQRAIDAAPEPQPEPEVTLQDVQAVFGKLIVKGDAMIVRCADYLVSIGAIDAAENAPKVKAIPPAKYAEAKAWADQVLAEVETASKGLL